MKKLSKPWHGPYIVCKKINEQNYEVKPKSPLKGKKMVVHFNRMKPYFELPDDRRQSPRLAERSKRQENVVQETVAESESDSDSDSDEHVFYRTCNNSNNTPIFCSQDPSAIVGGQEVQQSADFSQSVPVNVSFSQEQEILDERSPGPPDLTFHSLVPDNDNIVLEQSVSDEVQSPISSSSSMVEAGHGPSPQSTDGSGDLHSPSQVIVDPGLTNDTANSDANNQCTTLDSESEASEQSDTSIALPRRSHRTRRPPDRYTAGT